MQQRNSSFTVEIFQQEVLDYLSESLMLKEKHGSEESKNLLVNSLLRPPSISTIRVNTYHYKKDIVVDRKCGEAVLRGADVFAPGILGISKNCHSGSEIAILCDISSQTKKGFRFEKTIEEMIQIDENTKYQNFIYVGNGILKMDRTSIFQANVKGIGLEVTQPFYETCSLNEISQTYYNEFFAQNICSMVVAHLLDPKKGEKILDMCACPGGKTTHISNLMENEGELICCDRQKGKVDLLKKLSEKLGYSVMKPTVLDGTKATRRVNTDSSENQKSKKRKTNEEQVFLEENYFDRVLVDAPCSGLGQRPTLSFKEFSLDSLKKTAEYQRKILAEAFKVLKPGGILVFSTCTISPMENEENVLWMLENFHSKIELLTPNMTAFASEGLSSIISDSSIRSKVLRFDPVTTPETIGFFACKFKKLSN
ncbi:predicted protein [Naegleria gruberi]|uniref:Predicted protein n=1 Tax=Naegleria gruberi TaxID=5762 RepID=D2VKJ2_NAEGR|nr:uncharacterized protein NAEGRDRAFT_50302 [Naegleria gruberi]EFC42604.1 predicted protein [Naegleria gruberi]|eukprot:XP_002675348.1 predicted protein [Naegleria gruberi strain NEG-M]